MTHRAPTARHRRLVQELRRLRVERGLRQEDVAQQLDWSLSKQEKIERGAIAVRVPDVRAMLILYGLATPEHRAQHDALIRLARDARVKGWWHDYADAIPPWFEAYVGLEADASALHVYQGHFVPGLLQTEDYARSVYQAVRPTLEPEDIERAVAARMKRQARLTTRDPLHLWVILHEAVLLHQVGGPEVMRAQLDHLRLMGTRPTITIQVLPFAVGAHASMGTSFIVLKFPEPADPDIVYLEDLTSSAYLEDDPHLIRYNLVFDHLRTAALTDVESAALIERVVGTL